MDTTEYIWHNGKFVKWDQAKVHVLTHTLHYGAGAFEGIRMYKTEKGPAVFHLERHLDRLYYSAATVAMQIPFSKEQVMEATVELLRRNKVEACYIRPLVYYGYGVMGLNPANAPVEMAIACWPWGRYLPQDMVDLKIAKFARISPRTLVADAKICGHYVNSILAAIEIRGSKYHEALLLDERGNLAEGPGENIFLVKDGKLFTPKLGAILEGITRDTVIYLAADLALEVVEKDLSPEDAYQADEAFYTGTAAEVTPIRSINDKIIAGGKIGPITEQIKSAYSDVVLGRNPAYQQYLTYI